MLFVKFKWDCWHTQPEELSEGKLTNINEESGRNKKGKDVPGKMTTTKQLYIKAILRNFLWLETTKDKM